MPNMSKITVSSLEQSTSRSMRQAHAAPATELRQSQAWFVPALP